MNLRATLATALGLTAAVACGLTGCDTGNAGLSPKQQAALFSGAFIGSGLTTTVNIGSFSAAASLSQGGRAGHTATLLDTGNVLVVAGVDGNGAFHQENEIYDVAADTWTAVSTLNAANPNAGRLMDPTGAFVTGRQFHTAVKGTTGVVIVCGGLGFERLQNNQPLIEALTTTYTFNPTTNTFALSQTPMPTARYWHLSSLLSNGTMLTCVGWDQFGQGPKIALQSADIFDPASGGWTPVQGGAQALSAGHTYGNIHQFGQNVIVINGGRFDNAAPPTQQQMPIGLSVFGVSPQAVMIGSPGSTGKFSAGGEVYNVVNASFTNGPSPTRITPPRGILLSGATRLVNGSIFFAGGEDLGPNMDTRFSNLATTELLELQSGAFKAGPSIGDSVPPPQGTTVAPPIPTTHTEVAEISTTGDALVIGGAIQTQQGPMETPFCEIYDSLNNIMKGNLNMAEGRIDHRVVPIRGTTKILVIGGRDAAMNTPKDTCEIYSR